MNTNHRSNEQNKRLKAVMEMNSGQRGRESVVLSLANNNTTNFAYVGYKTMEISLIEALNRGIIIGEQ